MSSLLKQKRYSRKIMDFTLVIQVSEGMFKFVNSEANKSYDRNKSALGRDALMSKFNVDENGVRK